MIRRRRKSSKASVARLVAKCHPLWICTPLHICVFIVWIHLDLHFQMYMYTYWYVQLWTLVKLEISCQSIRPNWPTWENWGVRSPYYRWWTCQTWSTLPPSCIRVYAYMCIYVLVYDTVCLCIYVYEPVKRDKHRVRLVVRSISGDIMTSSLKSSLKML